VVLSVLLLVALAVVPAVVKAFMELVLLIKDLMVVVVRQVVLAVAVALVH